MIKNRFLAAVMAVLAGVAVVSCDEVQEIIDSVIEVSISAENDAFDDNGAATVKLSLNAPSNKDITVILGVSTEAQAGNTAVSADALDFEGTVKIPAGTEFIPVTIKINEKAEAGQQAVITIASATGATVGKDATVYIKVPASYSGDNGNGNGEEENKTDLSGATVWSIIGAFNNWAGDVELTKTGNEEWKINAFALSGEFKFRGNKEWGNYDLGVASGAQIVYGEPLELVHKGQNITIAEGVYDIVLYPTEYKAVFSPVETPPVNPDGAFVLDWTVKHIGCDWVLGYYSYGQLELFEVSNTNTEKFYHVILQDLNDGDDDIEALIAADAEGFFASMQEEVEELIAEEMEDYDETREEAVPWVFYNEINDGTEVLFYGLPAGKYQFVVLSMDDNGILDKGYSILNFEKTEDALEEYDWNLNLSVNPEWTAEYDGWIEGYEGKYYWVNGYAPGAAYVVIESYNDDELDEYLDGDIMTYFSYIQTDIFDSFNRGYSMDELATEVEEDGTFVAPISTYGLVGETHVYIAAFDENGMLLNTYGDSVVDVPEYVEEPIEFVEKTNWAVNYDATVDTGDEDYPYAVVATACDAPLFVIEVYNAGIADNYSLDEIAEDATYYVKNYGVSLCMQYGLAFDSVPAVYTLSKVKNGMEAFIFGIDESGKPTGEWYMEVIQGVEETPAADWKERTDWAVNYDASVDTGNDDYPQALVTTVCDAPYFVCTVWEAGDLEAYGLNEISEDALYYIDNYGMDVCLQYDVVHTAVPAVESWAGLENGMEAYIFGVDETGALTGEWHMENLTGIADESAALSIRKTPFKKNAVKLAKVSDRQKSFSGKKVRTATKVDASRPSFKASAKNQAKPNLNNKHVKLSK